MGDVTCAVEKESVVATIREREGERMFMGAVQGLYWWKKGRGWQSTCLGALWVDGWVVEWVVALVVWLVAWWVDE